MTICVRWLFFVQNFYCAWVCVLPSGKILMIPLWALLLAVVVLLWGLLCLFLFGFRFSRHLRFARISSRISAVFIALVSLKELNWPTTLLAYLASAKKKRCASQITKHFDFPVRHVALNDLHVNDKFCKNQNVWFVLLFIVIHVLLVRSGFWLLHVTQKQLAPETCYRKVVWWLNSAVSISTTLFCANHALSKACNHKQARKIERSWKTVAKCYLYDLCFLNLHCHNRNIRLITTSSTLNPWKKEMIVGMFVLVVILVGQKPKLVVFFCGNRQ